MKNLNQIMKNKYRIKEVWADSFIWYQPQKKRKWLWFSWWWSFASMYRDSMDAEIAIDNYEKGLKFKSVSKSYEPEV